MSDESRTEELRQELWELEFGCHADPEGLRTRIERDPELQRLHREVQAQAGMLREAAREELPPLDLSAPNLSTPEAEPPPLAPIRRPFWNRARRIRMVASLAAAALVWLGFAGHYGYRVWRESNVASSATSIHVSGPRGSVAMADCAFTVEARNPRGEARQAEVTYRAFNEDGKPIGEPRQQQIDGRSRIVIPAGPDRVARIEVTGADIPGAERLELEFVGGTARPLVHAQPDRPLYQPGEAARVRIVSLDRTTLEPRAPRRGLRANITDPNGNRVLRSQFIVLDDETGVGGVSWQIPEGVAGGRYRLQVLGDRAVELASAEVVVRRYQRERLAKSVLLGRDSYGPGESGSAAVRVARLGGGPAANAEVQASLWLDGTRVWQQQGQLDAEGRTDFRFDVPLDVDRGAARFVALIDDGGTVETALQTFVVPTGKLDVHMLPESGTLVAGVPNRIYATVTDPLDRGISARGTVVDDSGAEIASFETAGAGHARCEFTPEAGRRYHLRVDEPLLAQSIPLEARDDAIALRSLDDLQRGGAPLRLRVQRGSEAADGPLLAGVFCRGQLVGQATLDANAAGGDIEVPLDDRIAGVLRVTVFDRSYRPVAERLVRRAAHRPLQLAIDTGSAAGAMPGGKQSVEIIAQHADGRPAADVVLGVTVTDRQNWNRLGVERIGLRDTVELFGDVVSPSDAKPLLVRDAGDVSRSAAVRGDLLLGTRGWRRLLWDGDEERHAALDELGEDYVAVAARSGPLRNPQSVNSSRVVKQRQRVARRDTREASALVAGVSFVLIFLFILYFAAELAIGESGARRLSKPALVGRIVCYQVLAILLLGLITAPFLAPDILSANLGADMAQANADFPRATTAEAAQFDSEAADATVWFALQRAPELSDEEAELEPEIEGSWQREMAELRSPGRLSNFFYQSDGNPSLRDSFPETVAALIAGKTDAGGRLQLEFDLGEQVTTWQVDVDAHGHGRVGQARATFDANIPLRVDAALPAEVTAGDRLVLPVTVAAAPGARQDEPVSLTVQGIGRLRSDGTLPTEVTLDTAGNGRALAEFLVTGSNEGAPATAGVQLRAAASAWTDTAAFDLQVAPRGFPHARSQAGTLGEDVAALRLQIPVGAIRPAAKLRVFPNMLAQITQGLDGMLQEPHGCFEQTSSTSYPNTMVLALLEETGMVDPELEHRARGLLDRGYARLTGFECPQLGYEWFGNDPGHGELTAYGLLQFADLQRVYGIVEDDMLARTRGYVLDRRDGNGGFSAPTSSMHRFGMAPAGVRNAWCTYALLHAGEPAADLQPELDLLEQRASESNDPYELALVGCALGLAERGSAAAVRQRLATIQRGDGSLSGTSTSITASSGNDLIVETTALALLAWLAEQPADGTPLTHEAAGTRAWQWLIDQRRGSGTFGATQATIQALRALTAWSARSGKPSDGDGFVVVRDADGTELARRPFSVDDTTALEIDLAAMAPANGNLRGLELDLVDVDLSQQIPWVLDVTYHAEQPADDENAPLQMTARLPARAEQGEVVTLRAVVVNLLDERALPMTCAILGLPAGLEVRTAVLDDLVQSEVIAAWETRGREIVLYWRGLDAGARVDLAIECVARFPGTTTGPASRTWLYYAPDAVRWTEPLQIDIAPR